MSIANVRAATVLLEQAERLLTEERNRVAPSGHSEYGRRVAHAVTRTWEAIHWARDADRLGGFIRD